MYSLSGVAWAEVMSEEYEFAPGESILRQGVLSDHLYQILVGRCRIEMETSDGSQIVGYVGAGEVLGEFSFLIGVVSNFTAIAEDNVTVAMVSRSTAEAVLTDKTEFAIALYKFLAKTVCARMRRLELGNNSERIKKDAEPFVPMYGSAPGEHILQTRDDSGTKY